MELSALLAELQPYGARLVAVSKTQPIAAIRQLYDQGQRHFGENRVQDLLERKVALPDDICWHLIGHLQTNKVKYIADFVHCIHSVDSLRLLEEIDRQAQSCGRIIDVLIQLKVAQEETKYGLSRSAAEDLLRAAPSLPAVRVCGIMGMASFVDDDAQVAAEFAALQQHFVALKAAFYPNDSTFCELSMGMSSDYPLALRAGSTLVRVGSLLFGG